eukprot:9163631-Pyramimonas_sp.AAC.1
MTKLTLISVNVTRWKKRQETRLTPITQARAVAQAAGNDFDFLGGKPLPIQQIRPNASTTLDNSSVHG